MLAGRVYPGVVTRVLSAFVLAILAGGVAAAATLPRHLWTPGLGGATAFRHAEDTPLSGDSARFLSTYLDPDGRVVRRDQGGDTVSEGQAYGMLVAAAADDAGDFNAIWSWTKEHLARPDGLLAWHWEGGRVVDRMPASDGDLDAAWALSVASVKFKAPALAVEARRIASSILASEVEQTAVGPVLVAGPWAVQSGTTEPGYFSPEAFSALGRLTGDPMWPHMETTSAQILRRAMSGPRLPAEWVSVSNRGTVTPIASPSQADGPASYGLGAARVAAWWAASCSPSDRQVAAGEWSLLQTSARSGDFGISLSLSGQPQTTSVNATMAVTDGLAAAAAGQRQNSASLLSSAAQLERRYSTYYGGAWTALGYLLDSTDQLGNCPPP